MSHLENEILMRVSHLDGEKQKAILNYIRDLSGTRHNTSRHRRSAMKQIRSALEKLD